MSGSGTKLAKANAASTKSNQKVGKPSQSCPPKKGAVLTVTVKGKSGKGPPGALVRIHVKGPSSRMKFSKQKKAAKFEGLDAGEYEVTAFASGWVGVAEKKVKLKKDGKKSVTLQLHEVTVTKVEPAFKGKPVKWYINQTADAANAKGRKVKIQATLSKKLKNVQVHFAIEPGKKNNKKLSPAALEASLSVSSKMTDDQGVAEVELELSQFGGDEFRVSAHLEKAKLKDSKTKRSQWFQVWRRVYYEVALMHRPGKGTYDNVCNWPKVEKEYAKYFVELKRTAGGKATHHRAIAFTNFADWNGYTSPMRKPPAADTDRYFNMIVLDTVGKSTEVPVVHKYTVSHLHASVTLPGATEAFNEKRWCTAIQVRMKTSAGWSSWKPVPLGAAVLTTTGKGAKDYKVTFDLRNKQGLGAGPGLPAGTTDAQISLKLVHHTPLSGISWGDSTAVAIRWREAMYKGTKLKNSTANTLIHEAAHNLGLAPKYKSDGTSRAVPTSWYSKAGPHCHEDSNQCVMWESNLTKWKFCKVCADGLRARNLSNLPVSGSATH